MSLAECLVIAIIALLFIKPDDWPNVVRFVSNLVKQFRQLINEFHRQAGDILDQASLPEREQKAKEADKTYHQN